MHWYNILGPNDQKKLEYFYSSMPDLSNIRIQYISIEPFGANKLSLTCFLPFPDKEIPKWKEQGVNTAGVIMTFYGVHNILLKGLEASLIEDLQVSIEIISINKNLSKLVMKSEFLSLEFNFSDLSIGKIEGYIIEKDQL